MKKCAACNSEKWREFLRTETDRIMTGDQRIVPGVLNKVICLNCGTVTNKEPFSEQELNNLYGEQYEINTLGHGEHVFFAKEGPIARSQVFCDWIAPHIPSNFKSLLEIGCGEGLLLERIRKLFPDRTFQGIDGSRRAAELGRKRNLLINQGLILSKDAEIPKSDVIMLINVLEHLEDIPAVVSSLIRALNKGGRIIFCLPIQDFGGYDIFFAEHVWHFTVEQIEATLSRCNLRIIYSETEHPINHGIGLFVCERNIHHQEKILEYNDTLDRARQYWLKAFEQLDSEISQRPLEKVAVFGSGEVFTLFSTFTNLGKQNILACIDEAKDKVGKKKHGIKIFDIDWLRKNDVDAVFLATNSKYYDQVRNKLKDINTKLIPLLP